VFAIAITLLVLDLAIRSSGSPLRRVLDAWPFYLAYVVSFLTIGAAWLAHTGITDRLAKVDLTLLYALDAYARWEHLDSPGSRDEPDTREAHSSARRVVYGLAILIGLAVPVVAVGLYCAVAVFLVVPFGELKRLLFRRA
jgi:uncharacterized membrane protein